MCARKRESLSGRRPTDVCGSRSLSEAVNPRRVKLHRSYTVEEAAMLFKVHKNTVRGWLKSGLETVEVVAPP